MTSFEFESASPPGTGDKDIYVVGKQWVWKEDSKIRRPTRGY